MRKKPEYMVPEEGTIKADSYDRREWAELTTRSTKLKRIIEDGEIDYRSFRSLMQDVAMSLNNREPEFVPDTQIRPSLRLNKAIMEKTMSLGEWQDVRAWTQDDLAASALGSVNISKKINEMIPEEMKKAAEEAEQKVREAEEAEQRAQEQQQMADQLQQAAEQARQDGNEKQAEKLEKQAQKAQEKAQKSSQQAQDAQAQAQAMGQQLDQQGQQVASGMAKAIKKVLQDEAQEQAETAEAMTQFGAGPAEREKMPPESRIELADKLKNTKQLRKIAELAGRFKSIGAHKRKNKAQHPPTDVFDVELGNDLSRVLPSELMYLASPQLVPQFYSKYSEKKLLQYEKKGKEKEGRGPITACLDGSSSMADGLGGGYTREEWSKAVLLALFDLARRQNRPFACIQFAHEERDMAVFRFKKPKQADPNHVLEMITLFLRGGTDYVAPLKKSLEIIKESSFKKADIVFLSDGECHIPSDFLEEFKKTKEQKEFSCYGILLGNDSSGEILKSFCDKTAKVTHSTDTATVEMVLDI